MESTLTPGTLVLPKEQTYYRILLVISLIAWLLVVVTVIGLIYGALVAFFVWLVNGLLVARLKSEAVHVTPEQLPELYAAHQEVCGKLGLAEIPDLYLLQSHGVLNAFATRHSGRNFVAIYSDLLEALGHNTAEVRFLIGHEIGHIQRKHLFKHILLLPGFMIPLIGKAYHRACEATCDRFGALASGNIQGAVRAMVALAAGKEAIPLVNAPAFAQQYYQQRGFFVSWHELNSGYPTLAQRTRNLLGIDDPGFRRPAERHALAYPFAFFTLSVGTLVLLYLIIILGCIATPAIKQGIAKAAKAKALQTQNAAHKLEQQADQQPLDLAPAPLPPSAPAPMPAPAPEAPAPDAPSPGSAAPAPSTAPAN